MGVYLWNNVYEYSYDFRGKSSTILTNDWWTIASWTPSFWTYWMYWETIRITRPCPQMALAKKIILEYTTYAWASNTSSTWGLGKTVNSSTREWLTRGYFERANNKYSVMIYDRMNDYTGTLPTWNSYTEKIVIDLEWKTFTCDMTWQTQKSWTITDTEVTNIRTNSNVMWAYTYMSNNSSWLTSVYMCIES